MSQRQRVSPNTFFYGLDNVANAGEFFVAYNNKFGGRDPQRRHPMHVSTRGF